MIKIPATEAGYGAMEHLASLGININATLIFSPEQAQKSAEALDKGIKKSGKDTKGVVSVFVSRFDKLLDEQLKNKELETAKFGIVNATKCYHLVEEINNANIRTLFASTGVKSKELKESYYVDNLIFPHTINTAPLSTINSWIENGAMEKSEILSEIECDNYFNELIGNKIDINTIYDNLFKDGLSAFKVSFQELLKKVKL
jgi:transaldolase